MTLLSGVGAPPGAPGQAAHGARHAAGREADIYIYIYISYINTYTYIHIYVCIYISLSLSPYMHIYMHIYIYIYVCVCMYIYIYIYIYITQYVYHLVAYNSIHRRLLPLPFSLDASTLTMLMTIILIYTNTTSYNILDASTLIVLMTNISWILTTKNSDNNTQQQ